MKERLEQALHAAEAGDMSLLPEANEMLTRLPKTEEGIFDGSALGDDVFGAGRILYPLYAAYETECNREARYPDLLAQIQVLDKERTKQHSLQANVEFLDLLLATIDFVTPQLYEYYRALEDIFRAVVKETIAAYYHDGAFGSASEKALDAKLRNVIRHAGETDVLLAEKYAAYR